MRTFISRLPNGQNSGRNLLGQRFGQLTITADTGARCPHGYKVWRARCDCGSLIERPSYRFARGLKTCGCGPTGRRRIPDNGAHVNALYAHARNGAQQRGLSFTLTRDQARALFEAPCTYCGTEPPIRPTHQNLSGEYAANGIDRVDNARGYEPDNVCSCCTTCNVAKAQMTVAEFRDWISRVHRHLRLD